MATTVNEPMYSDEGERARRDTLAATFSRSFVLNWEIVVFATILLVAIFTRFYDLGARAMSHDESLHVYYSYELYSEGRFVHTPLMHGPILFHATAFFYSLFGDNDFTGRIYAALLGVFMVMSPLLFRRWLGRWGTILACVMILISPLLMYYNRYIREDTPAIMSSILMAWAILMYLKGPENQKRRAHWLYILSAAMIWNLGSKETAFFYIGIFGLFLLLYWFVRLAQYFYNTPGRSLFNFLMIGFLIAGFAALGMYIVLDITPLEKVREIAATSGWFTDIEPRSFVIWSLIVFLAVSALVVGTMFWGFRDRFSKLPLRQLALLAVVIFVVLSGLILIEELSHVENTASEVPQSQPVPGEEATTVTQTAGFSWTPVIAAWVLMVIILGGLFVSRSAGWWRHLDQFPELDVMIVMGALVLPWLTAIFILATRGSPEAFSSIGASIPDFLRGIMPVSGELQTGQFVVGFLCWLPLMIIAIATGLTWNWQRFLVCFVIFHAIFAFFFTTIFTNINGLATGMIYSLQYWMEQQGERRGNQPQYYYLLIILPMYEFLPIIGSLLATIAGVGLFWRRRRNYEVAHESLQIADVNDGESAEVVTATTSDEGVLVDKPKRGLLAPEDARRTIAILRQLQEPSFLMFVAWWAIFIIIGLTLAGEKMPWLGTHMTLPMIFLTAWFFGSVFDRISWNKFADRGWIYLLLFPFLFVTIFQLIFQPLGGRVPFRGTELEQIQATNTWLAAAVLTAGLAYGIYRLAQYTGWRHFRHMLVVAVFAALALITFRAAWMASFVNYDLAKEFLVYAHGTPGTKIVADKLEELSLRTTNGYAINFAYDDKMSWPGVWYFRHYPDGQNGKEYMGRNPTLQQMEGAAVVMVGEANRSVVEPLLEDRYQRFEYSRMWWPMMDYFNLTGQRIIDTFWLGGEHPTNPNLPAQAAQVRRGLFDIWWNRDYTAYGEALNKDFSLPNWPVQEKMYMYVRKDIAAQVWQYGVGDGTIASAVEQEEISACVSNWQEIPASVVFNTATGGLQLPIGLDVSQDGTLYVAEDGGDRLSKFNSQTGEYLGTFGQSGTGEMAGAFFERPNSVEFGPNGDMIVADTWNHKIRVFDPNGEPVTMWGQWIAGGIEAPAQPADGFWGPRDVAVDSAGNIYVADTGNKRIRVYDSTGQWLRDIGSGGSAPGELDEPSGIDVSADGRLFVADTWNRRVSVFNVDGTFLTTYNLKAWYEVLGSRPYLAVDPNRNIFYVTDPEGGRVLVYTLDGECVGAFGRPNRENPTSSQFHTLGGIAVDNEGNVYVADTSTARVLKFSPFPVSEEVLSGDAGEAVIEIPAESTAEVQSGGVEVLATEEITHSETTAEVVVTEEPAAETDETQSTAETQP
jgi:DNA-binding beta-propeller fold protein YncE